MSSLRNRLFAILLTATGIIWLAAICWIYVASQREIESVLDARLQEAARMASSLIPNDSGPHSSSRLKSAELASTERQLSCQIWSLDGRMVARSSGAPDERLSDVPNGFSERVIDGETWRVFTMENADKGVRVLVGDRLGVRDHLVAEIIKGLLTPALFVIPLLGLLIWASLHRGFVPLRNIANELKHRSADDTSLIAIDRAPIEIQPLVTALNELFVKVQDARQREREITAFAAHELRTPLAGLRMQAQISMSAVDDTTRQAALRQILVSVDRTSRLVRQLLAISKLDATRIVTPESNVNVGSALEEVVEALAPANDGIHVTIEPTLRMAVLPANRELLLLALRNLHENAIGHMQEGGTVRWLVEQTANTFIVAVEDDGPGIPDEEIHLVTKRFFRGRHKSPSGSGLGLAIVDLALRASGAELRLKNRPTGGLRVEMQWRFPIEGGRRNHSAPYRGTLRLIKA
ncbi:Sensor protein QseC [Afipia felis]|uniref:histidine kinase n=1 Tax=Afipia felis TaxID=1035 RepID=A0A090MP04_AFIFE|nr:ATP-binding protein [Afipia felis]CEG09135.1 Sensor protein QseC [Afipia felis]